MSNCNHLLFLRFFAASEPSAKGGGSKASEVSGDRDLEQAVSRSGADLSQFPFRAVFGLPWSVEKKNGCLWQQTPERVDSDTRTQNTQEGAAYAEVSLTETAQQRVRRFHRQMKYRSLPVKARQRNPRLPLSWLAAQKKSKQAPRPMHQNFRKKSHP